MKRILIFACFVSLAVASSSDAMFQEFTKYAHKEAKECAKEMGLSQDIVDRFFIERKSTDLEPMGCMKACVMKKLGIMVNGKMSLEALCDVVDNVVGKDSKYLGELYKLEYTCLKRTKNCKSECELGLEFINCASSSLDHILH